MRQALAKVIKLSAYFPKLKASINKWNRYIKKACFTVYVDTGLLFWDRLEILCS